MVKFQILGSDEIHFSDFITLMGKTIKEPLSEQDFETSFKCFDKDKDGLLSVTDVQTVFISQGTDLTEMELNEVFMEYDEDKDGIIDYQGMLSSYVLCAKCFEYNHLPVRTDLIHKLKARPYTLRGNRTVENEISYYCPTCRGMSGQHIAP